MTTYAQHLELEMKSTKASKSPDKIMTRFIELHESTQRTKLDDSEYKILEASIRSNFKASQAKMKAKKIVEKNEWENRKVDSHAKILIGIAAMTLAKNDPALREKLLNDASQMQSVNLDAIKNLLN